MQSFRPHAVALAAVLLACLPTIAFQRFEPAVPPLTTFLVAITVAAWYGGRNPGLTATALSALASAWLLGVPAPADFQAHLLRVALMVAVGVGVSFLAGSLHVARQELRRENSRLNAVMDHLPAAIVIVDEHGRVVRSNSLVREILRHDIPSTVTENRWTAQEPDGTPIPPSGYVTSRALRGERVIDKEMRYVRGDGTGTWLRASSAPLYEDGRPAGAVSLFSDIGVEKEGKERLQVMDGVTIDFTQRKQLEESLERQTASLRDADRRKDEFLAVLGHELRNPLAPMRTALELQRMKPGDAAMMEKTSAVFGRQLAQLTRLVDELLEVSRIASGKLRLEHEVTDLRELMREALETSEPLIQSRRHTVEFRPPEQAVRVHVDRARMIQVFTNLLNNAAKYTDPGGGIEFSVRREGPRGVEVSVVDNGIGIEREALPRVFELFSQTESGLSRAQGGLGLGLNVVRRLVELHGGSVSAHSEGPGRGSRFTVTLQVVEPARAAAD